MNNTAEILRKYGEQFAGNNVEDAAQDWLDHGFTAESVDGWCEIGVWDAATAAKFRDAGLTPGQVKKASNELVEGLDRDLCDRFTDGDPIYSTCNGDTAAWRIINQARK